MRIEINKEIVILGEESLDQSCMGRPSEIRRARHASVLYFSCLDGLNMYAEA